MTHHSERISHRAKVAESKRTEFAALVWKLECVDGAALHEGCDLWFAPPLESRNNILGSSDVIKRHWIVASSVMEAPRGSDLQTT
jgi:hypothetical protein